jgi:TolB-like protein
MSPEQASGEEVDARSDLYALGCVLYEMLAGEPPLVGPTPQSTAAKRLTDRPTPLPALRTTVPPELDHAVQKALERSPADRYATAPELARAIEEVPAGHLVRPAGRRVWVGLTAVVTIGALALAGWLALRSPEAVPAVEQNSIAVLPFVNMSDDPGNEYFSDGISEELLNLLAKVPELRVTSRSSAFSFKGQNLTIAEIAERLNVAHILEGSVRKAGEEVRITAQLIDTRSDTHLWSETWDRTLEDIFLIQDEIASEVVAQLRITLLGGTPMAAVVDPAAYSMFLQGRYLVRQQSAEGYEQGTALIERALAIDSAYAPGWTALAVAYRSQTDYALLPYEEGLARAREAATRALKIDPDYAPAHAALGHVSSAVWGNMDLAASARHYERALELEPANLEILRGAAFLMESLGRPADAIAIHQYVVKRDPVNVYSLYRMGINLLRSDRLEEAMAAFETVRSLSPERIGVQYSIGLTLLRQNRPEAALREIEQEPWEGLRLDGLILAHHALGQAAQSDSALAVMIEGLASRWSYNIAYGLAFRGEADRAFEWLEKALRYHDAGLDHIPNQYLFASLYDDPRWLPFLESIGKSPEQLAAIDFEVTLPE